MSEVKREHREAAVLLIRPRCDSEGVRVFSMSPEPNMLRVAQALADLEAATEARVRLEQTKAFAATLRLIQDRCWKTHGHRPGDDGVCFVCLFKRDESLGPPPPDAKETTDGE